LREAVTRSGPVPHNAVWHVADELGAGVRGDRIHG
jgi:hypothetical protein